MRGFNRIPSIGSLYDLSKRESKMKTSDVFEDIGRLHRDNEKLVEFIAYCLNPNHYHFILRQLENDGVSRFMKRLGNGYTKYFNYKYDHSGFLFQGKFKARHIKDNASLIWLSVYVNANTEIHNITSRAEKYKWCSFPDYLGLRKGTLCDKEAVLGQFYGSNDYKQYTEEILPIIRENKEFKKYIIE